MEINRKVHRLVKRCAIRTNLCVAPHEKASAQGRAPEAIKARTKHVRFPVTFRTAFQVTKKRKDKRNWREATWITCLSGWRIEREKDVKFSGIRKRNLFQVNKLRKTIPNSNFWITGPYLFYISFFFRKVYIADLKILFDILRSLKLFQ